MTTSIKQEEQNKIQLASPKHNIYIKTVRPYLLVKFCYIWLLPDQFGLKSSRVYVNVATKGKALPGFWEIERGDSMLVMWPPLLWPCMLHVALLKWHKGGFQLLALIIPELKHHVIPYKLKCSHWWKIHL